MMFLVNIDAMKAEVTKAMMGRIEAIEECLTTVCAVVMHNHPEAKKFSVKA
jgi:hypothetical protein